MKEIHIHRHTHTNAKSRLVQTSDHAVKLVIVNHDISVDFPPNEKEIHLHEISF